MAIYGMHLITHFGKMYDYAKSLSPWVKLADDRTAEEEIRQTRPAFLYTRYK